MKTYEMALEELKGVIEQLEGGDLTLDEALKLFEKGVNHINFCRRKLDEVRKRVEILVESAPGELKREEFSLED